MALIKLSYNNSYHASIGMTLHEALYGRKCRTPLYWQEIDEALTIGPELIQATTNKIRTNESSLEPPEKLRRLKT